MSRLFVLPQREKVGGVAVGISQITDSTAVPAPGQLCFGPSALRDGRTLLSVERVFETLDTAAAPVEQELAGPKRDQEDARRLSGTLLLLVLFPRDSRAFRP